MQRNDYAFRKVGWIEDSIVAGIELLSFRVFLEAPSYTDVTYHQITFSQRRETRYAIFLSWFLQRGVTIYPVPKKNDTHIFLQSGSNTKRQDLRNILLTRVLFARCTIVGIQRAFLQTKREAVHRAEEKKSA